MQNMQLKRTVKDILRYIQMRNRDGIVHESMITMAKETGYSNATIHRSLKTLEKEGYIKIIPTPSQKEPNKIFYIGPSYDDLTGLMNKAGVAIDELIEAMMNIKEIMNEIQSTTELMQKDSDHIQLH